MSAVKKEDFEAKCFQKNRVNIVKQISSENTFHAIIDELLAKDIVTNMMIEEVMVQRTLSNKIRNLIDILMKRQQGTLAVFCQALANTGHSDLCKMMEQTMKSFDPEYSCLQLDAQQETRHTAPTLSDEELRGLLADIADDIDKEELEELKLLFRHVLKGKHMILKPTDLFDILMNSRTVCTSDLASLVDALTRMQRNDLCVKIKHVCKDEKALTKSSCIRPFTIELYKLGCKLSKENIDKLIFLYNIKGFQKTEAKNRWKFLYILLERNIIIDNNQDSIEDVYNHLKQSVSSQVNLRTSEVSGWQDSPANLRTSEVSGWQGSQVNLRTSEVSAAFSTNDDYECHSSRITLPCTEVSAEPGLSFSLAEKKEIDLINQADNVADSVRKSNNPLIVGYKLRTAIDRTTSASSREEICHILRSTGDGCVSLQPAVSRELKTLISCLASRTIDSVRNVLNQLKGWVFGNNEALTVHMVKTRNNKDVPVLIEFPTQEAIKVGMTDWSKHSLRLIINIYNDYDSSNVTEEVEKIIKINNLESVIFKKISDDLQNHSLRLDKIVYGSIIFFIVPSSSQTFSTHVINGDIANAVCQNLVHLLESHVFTDRITTLTINIVTGSMAGASTVEEGNAQENSQSAAELPMELPPIEPDFQPSLTALRELSIRPNPSDASGDGHCPPMELQSIEPDSQPSLTGFGVLSIRLNPLNPSDASGDGHCSNSKDETDTGATTGSTRTGMSAIQLKGDDFPDNITACELTRREMNEYFNEREEMCHGGAGQIFKGNKKYKNCDVVVKVMFKCTDHVRDKKAHQSYCTEMMCSRKKHPYLMPLLAYSGRQQGDTPEERQYCLMYPFMKNYDLRCHMKKVWQENSEVKLPWKDRIRILYQAAVGLQFLHSCGEDETRKEILHRDVKASNILLDENLNARLGDPGLAKMLREDESCTGITTQVGTSGYIDPHAIMSSEFRPINDVFGLGVVMLELLLDKPEKIDCKDKKGKLIKRSLELYWRSKSEKELLGAVASAWPEEDEQKKFTEKFVNLAWKAIAVPKEDEDIHDKRISLDELCRELKTLLVDAKIETWNSSSTPHVNTLCVSCMGEQPVKVKPLSSSCNENCALFCKPCLKEHWLNPLCCPKHGSCLPPVGHKNIFVLMVSGKEIDRKKKVEREIFAVDLEAMKRVLLDKDIIGVRSENISTIVGKDKSNESLKDLVLSKVEELAEKMKNEEHVFFMFYYSGHHSKAQKFLMGKDSSDVISDQELKDSLNKLNAEYMLFILDTCYSGGADLGTKGDGSSTEMDSQPLEEEDCHPKLWDLFDLQQDCPDLQPKGDNTHHVIQWSSSFSDQLAFYITQKKQSIFTRSITKLLEGKCLESSTHCNHCKSFHDNIKHDDFILLKKLHNNVFNHVKQYMSKWPQMQLPQLSPVLDVTEFPPLAYKK